MRTVFKTKKYLVEDHKFFNQFFYRRKSDYYYQFFPKNGKVSVSDLSVFMISFLNSVKVFCICSYIRRPA